MSITQSSLPSKYRKAIQLMASSSNALLRRDSIGITKENLKKILGTGANSDSDIQEFIDISNMVLAQETIQARLLYDDVIGRYIYVQMVDPFILAERLKPGQLFLFLLMFYKQRVLGEKRTTLIEILNIVDPSVTDKPVPKVRMALENLADHSLIKIEGEAYRVTMIGENFMTPLLLKRLTDIVMTKNYSMQTILNFYRQEIFNPDDYKEVTVNEEYNLFVGGA